LFVYLFIYLFIYLSLGWSVTGALGGLGMGDMWLGWGLVQQAS